VIMSAGIVTPEAAHAEATAAPLAPEVAGRAVGDE